MRTGILFILLFFLAPSCRKGDAIPASADTSTFRGVFDVFWSEMSKSYVFWDVDKLNWDSVYLTYRSLFDSLDISNEEDNKKALEYFRLITSSIIDGHFTMTFKNRFLQNYIIYPSYYKKESHGFSPFNYTKIDTAYLDSGYVFGRDDNIMINGNPMAAVCGTIHHEVVYFSCNAFNLFKIFNAPQENDIKKVLQKLLEYIRTKNYKGIIIDVRSNPGGDVEDINFLVGQFVSQKQPFGFSRYKIGNGRFDYSPSIQAFINPVGDATGFTGRKIVLTDRFSASVSEFITMAIRSLPDSYVVGDTTWGATGVLTDHTLYNAGQFDVGNFMKVTISSMAFIYIDNKMYEGTGFPPDLPVLFDLQATGSGRDPALEKAISLMK